MTPKRFLESVINPGLERLAIMGGPQVTPEAQRIMLAIALQESGPNLQARYQNSPAASAGPARGFWQFEQNGGVAGVLQHHASRDLAHALCENCSVVSHSGAVWRALEGHDDLAAGFARLLLLTDAQPLPTDESSGWHYYMRNWRPGKPHPDRWQDNWREADRTVRE